MTGLAPTSELTVPNSRGSVIGAIGLAAFILFFVVVAVRNLLDGVARIASILWLLLVGAVIVGICREQGVRRFLIHLLGAYTLRQFVWSLPTSKGAAEIQVGYRLFGHRLVYFRVPANRIESVEWHAGQASSRCGRDMNDWSVALWYVHGDPIKSERNKQFLKPDQDVFTVGPSSRRELTVAFGQSVLKFLREAGADLVPGEDEFTFVRKSAN